MPRSGFRVVALEPPQEVRERQTGITRNLSEPEKRSVVIEDVLQDRRVGVRIDDGVVNGPHTNGSAPRQHNERHAHQGCR